VLTNNFGVLYERNSACRGRSRSNPYIAECDDDVVTPVLTFAKTFANRSR
jgi:hypothetical protein